MTERNPNFINPVERILSTEFEEDDVKSGILWIRFDYNNSPYTVNVVTVRNETSKNRSKHVLKSKAIILKIKANDGTAVGTISGIMHQNATSPFITFESIISKNNTVVLQTGDTPKKLSNYVPRIIQQTIKQLIMQGEIQEWHSSDVLLSGGKVLYENLTHEQTLKVNKKINGYFRDGTPDIKYSITSARST